MPSEERQRITDRPSLGLTFDSNFPCRQVWHSQLEADNRFLGIVSGCVNNTKFTDLKDDFKNMSCAIRFTVLDLYGSC